MDEFTVAWQIRSIIWTSLLCEHFEHSLQRWEIIDRFETEGDGHGRETRGDEIGRKEDKGMREEKEGKGKKGRFKRGGKLQ